MPPITPRLLLSTKTKAAGNNTNQTILYRTLERWSAQMQSSGGGGGGYASLTGPGETTTPGDLTQLGGLLVDAAGGNSMGAGGFSAYTNYSTPGDGGGASLRLQNNGTGSLTISSGSSGAGVGIGDVSTHGVSIDTSAGPGPINLHSNAGNITAFTNADIILTSTSYMQFNNHGGYLQLNEAAAAGSGLLQLISQHNTIGLTTWDTANGAIGLNSGAPSGTVGASTNNLYLYPQSWTGGGPGPGILLQCNSGHIFLLGLPTSAPAITGAVWNNAGVLHIV